MTQESTTAIAMELFSSSTAMERTLRFKTEDGSAICLRMILSFSDRVSDKDLEDSQSRFQDLQERAIDTFSDRLQ